ncbi:MAG: WD40/YVTN/BNR-like repeat-containing protein, partial [Bacteroidales bacterium]
MKKLTILFLIILGFSAASHAQWEINHTNTEYTLRPVFFADANTGYVAGINRRNGLEFVSILLKTEDGGATWAQVLKVDTMRFQDVFFTNAKTGYLIGQAKKGERLLRTTDGGLTWKVQPTTYVRGRSFKQIHFTTPDNGIITGAYGMLMQTTDAGAHWTKLPEAP